MKRILLPLLILALLAGSGYALFLWYSRLSLNTTDQDLPTKISLIKKRFLKGYPSQFTLRQSDLIVNPAFPEISDPALALPHSHLYPFSEIAALSEYAETCDQKPPIILTNLALKKALEWQEHRCGKRPNLQVDFFDNPPLMHPSGASYVWLARQSGNRFNDPQWYGRYRTRMHLIERLREPSETHPAVEISQWELQNLLKGEKLVQSAQFLFVSTSEDQESKNENLYLAFNLRSWLEFNRQNEYQTTTSMNGGKCLHQEGNLCWQINEERRLQPLRVSLMVSLVLASALFGTLVYLILRHLQKRKKEAEERLFTLQLLTHEIRTPTTSLKLWAEVFRDQFDLLPERSQKSFLKICEELQRLERLVDESRNYLQSDRNADRGLKTAKPILINQFLNDTLRSIDDQISFQGLAEEQTVWINPYWVDLCVKNLIKNALAHGARPISVSLATEANSLILSVTDGGVVLFSTLEEMLKPFQKSSQSSGLGLGLTIVHRVVTALNAELTFQSRPTTFSIKFKDLLCPRSC